MGNKLLKEENHPQKKLTNLFQELFPSFLAIGMTYDQFFNDDVYLVKYYINAEILKNKKKNEEMWLQGLYIYNALTVVNFNINKKKHEKQMNYPSKPYDLRNEDIQKSKELRKKEEQAKAEVWLNNFVNAYKNK